MAFKFIALIIIFFALPSEIFGSIAMETQRKAEEKFIWEGGAQVPGPGELYIRGEERIQFKENRESVKTFDENSLDNIFFGIWNKKLEQKVPNNEKFEYAFDVPVDRHRLVEKYMDYFSGPGNRYYNLWLERLQLYRSYIIDKLRQNAIPEDTVSLAFIESGMNPNAISSAKAVGIWQFMPQTGRRFGLRLGSYIDERRDPVKSTKAAITYLKWLY